MRDTRVPIGHKYYFVSSRDDYYTELTVSYRYESGHPVDNSYFGSGNYFATEADALKMADKINALFSGADVIEVPESNEVDMIQREIGLEIGGEDEELVDAASLGAIKMINWLIDKIVK